MILAKLLLLSDEGYLLFHTVVEMLLFFYFSLGGSVVCFNLILLPFDLFTNQFRLVERKKKYFPRKYTVVSLH